MSLLDYKSNIEEIVNGWNKQEIILSRFFQPYIQLLKTVVPVGLKFKRIIDYQFDKEYYSDKLFTKFLEKRLHTHNIIVDINYTDDELEIKSELSFVGEPILKDGYFQTIKLDIIAPQNRYLDYSYLYFLSSIELIFVDYLWYKIISKEFKELDLIQLPNPTESRYFKAFNKLWKCVATKSKVSNFMAYWSDDGKLPIYHPIDRDFLISVTQSNLWKWLVIAMSFFTRNDNSLCDRYFILKLLHGTISGLCEGLYFANPFFPHKDYSFGEPIDTEKINHILDRKRKKLVWKNNYYDLINNRIL